MAEQWVQREWTRGAGIRVAYVPAKDSLRPDRLHDKYILHHKIQFAHFGTELMITPSLQDIGGQFEWAFPGEIMFNRKDNHLTSEGRKFAAWALLDWGRKNDADLILCAGWNASPHDCETEYRKQMDFVRTLSPLP